MARDMFLQRACGARCCQLELETTLCLRNLWWECCPALNSAVEVMETALLGMAAPPGRMVPGPSLQ